LTILQNFFPFKTRVKNPSVSPLWISCGESWFSGYSESVLGTEIKYLWIALYSSSSSQPSILSFLGFACAFLVDLSIAIASQCLMSWLTASHYSALAIEGALSKVRKTHSSFSKARSPSAICSNLMCAKPKTISL